MSPESQTRAQSMQHTLTLRSHSPLLKLLARSLMAAASLLVLGVLVRQGIAA